MHYKLLLGAAAVFIALHPAQARDRLEIVGSSITGPFSMEVSERFARGSGFPAPRVEQTGNGGGFDRFCAGIGDRHPDIVGASRPISDNELTSCRKNGVRNITEIKIGYEAVVLAVEKTAGVSDLSMPEIFAALAKDVEVGGKIVKNPHESWREINDALPEKKIEFLGPAAGGELYDVFVGGFIAEGCTHYPSIAALEGRERDLACSLIRTDGRYKAFRANDPDLLGRVKSHPGSIGVFPYSALSDRNGSIRLVAIEKVPPSMESIAAGEYRPSRPLFLYTKNQHFERVPGFLEFVNEYTSERAWGPEGYLVDEGLVPLSDDERRRQRSNAIGLNPMW